MQVTYIYKVSLYCPPWLPRRCWRQFPWRAVPKEILILMSCQRHMVTSGWWGEREMCTEVSITKMQLLPGLGPEGVMGSNYQFWQERCLLTFPWSRSPFYVCSSGKLSTWQILQKSFIIIDHFYVVLFTSLEQTVWFNWWSACGQCSQLMTSDTKLLSVLGGSSTSL